MTLAFSYVRFSTPDQASGHSKKRQQEDFDRFCADHNLTPDQKFVDEGKSARTGKHKEEGTGFAAFLDLVKAGQIPQGSVLVVEALDRLSRELPDIALSQMCSIIRAGCNVGVCRMRQIFTPKELRDPWAMQNAFSAMILAFQESEQKAQRGGAAWGDKKKSARKDKRPLTKNLPHWLYLDGKVQKDGPAPTIMVDESKAAIVRKIFRMSKDGLGISTIAKRLNAECVPVIVKEGKRNGGRWRRSYIAKLLTNRAVLGEHQPYKWANVQNKKGETVRVRVPDGPPIKLYPAIITEDEWHMTQASKEERRHVAGREATHRTNLFAGLLYDAASGSKLHSHEKRGDGKAVLIPYHLAQGMGKYTSFPTETLEAALLEGMKEIRAKDILPTTQDNTGILAGKLADVEKRIEKLTLRLIDTNDEDDPVIDAVRGLHAQRKQLKAELQAAIRANATPLSEAWDNLYSFMQDNREEKDIEERLRVVVRRIVERIDCFFTTKGRIRIAAVELTFMGGHVRKYVVWHRLGYKAHGPYRPSEWGYQTGASDNDFKSDDGTMRHGFAGKLRDLAGTPEFIEHLQWMVTGTLS